MGGGTCGICRANVREGYVRGCVRFFLCAHPWSAKSTCRRSQWPASRLASAWRVTENEVDESDRTIQLVDKEKRGESGDTCGCLQNGNQHTATFNRLVLEQKNS